MPPPPPYEPSREKVLCSTTMRLGPGQAFETPKWKIPGYSTLSIQADCTVLIVKGTKAEVLLAPVNQNRYYVAPANMRVVLHGDDDERDVSFVARVTLDPMYHSSVSMLSLSFSPSSDDDDDDDESHTVVATPV